MILQFQASICLIMINYLLWFYFSKQVFFRLFQASIYLWSPGKYLFYNRRQVWATARDLGALGGKEILGHTGDDDDDDYEEWVDVDDNDDDDAYHYDHDEGDIIGSGGRPKNKVGG